MCVRACVRVRERVCRGVCVRAYQVSLRSLHALVLMHVVCVPLGMGYLTIRQVSSKKEAYEIRRFVQQRPHNVSSLRIVDAPYWES